MCPLAGYAAPIAYSAALHKTEVIAVPSAGGQNSDLVAPIMFPLMPIFFGRFQKICDEGHRRAASVPLSTDIADKIFLKVALGFEDRDLKIQSPVAEDFSRLQQPYETPAEGGKWASLQVQ